MLIIYANFVYVKETLGIHSFTFYLKLGILGLQGLSVVASVYHQSGGGMGPKTMNMN